MGLTEFTSLEAIDWTDFRGTMTSSAPAITKTGNFSTAFSNNSSFFGVRTVSYDSLPISWRASSQPSTFNGAWCRSEKPNVRIIVKYLANKHEMAEMNYENAHVLIKELFGRKILLININPAVVVLHRCVRYEDFQVSMFAWA